MSKLGISIAPIPEGNIQKRVGASGLRSINAKIMGRINQKIVKIVLGLVLGNKGRKIMQPLNEMR